MTVPAYQLVCCLLIAARPRQAWQSAPAPRTMNDRAQDTDLNHAYNGAPPQLYRKSQVDFANPDGALFPAFAAVRAGATVVTLGPGDMLYIPPMVAHHVEALDAVRGCLSAWSDCQRHCLLSLLLTAVRCGSSDACMQVTVGMNLFSSSAVSDTAYLLQIMADSPMCDRPRQDVQRCLAKLLALEVDPEVGPREFVRRFLERRYRPMGREGVTIYNIAEANRLFRTSCGAPPPSPASGGDDEGKEQCIAQETSSCTDGIRAVQRALAVLEASSAGRAAKQMVRSIRSPPALLPRTAVRLLSCDHLPPQQQLQSEWQ
eukprot:SAG22_NODE_2034_length_3104_cov_1.785691_2_plen_316_part_00